MSISAEPWKAPCCAMWMTRESMVASTVPSTTSVSQSVISTPLSLMLGPTVSLLPPCSATGLSVGAGAALTSGATARGCCGSATGVGLFRPLPGVLFKLPTVPGRVAKFCVSRLVKKGLFTAMHPPDRKP